MLSSTSFGDNSFLTHSFSKQSLTNNVIDLVRARVVEVFTFQYQSNTELLT